MDFGGIDLTALDNWQSGHITYNKIKAIFRTLRLI